jgi:5-deoxy-glucuronate isomerase
MTDGDAQPTTTIHPTKLAPLPPDRLRIEPAADGSVATDPARSGWRYLSFRTAHLGPGVTLELREPARETAIVTISGGGVDIAVDGGPELRLPGRPSVFEGMPWSAYLPAGADARITGRPLPGREAVIAIANTPLTGRAGVATEPILVTPDDVEIEIRGAGNATRQINNIMMPAFPADRLLVCEVFTPNGNWSGWPPHKHDVDDMPREAVLEETYYYQMSRPEGWAIQRIYHKDGTRDVLLPVRHGDLVVVDQGYHPFASTQGYDAYYLNVLAGDRRTMANSDDPELAWVRSLWPAMTPDPRLPLVRP